MKITNENNTMYYIDFKDYITFEDKKYYCHAKIEAYVLRDISKNIMAIRINKIYRNKLGFNLMQLFKTLNSLNIDQLNISEDQQLIIIKGAEEEIDYSPSSTWETVAIAAIDLTEKQYLLGIELVI